jgi:hypothetical protein
MAEKGSTCVYREGSWYYSFQILTPLKQISVVRWGLRLNPLTFFPWGRGSEYYNVCKILNPKQISMFGLRGSKYGCKILNPQHIFTKKGFKVLGMWTIESISSDGISSIYYGAKYWTPLHFFLMEKEIKILWMSLWAIDSRAHFYIGENISMVWWRGFKILWCEILNPSAFSGERRQDIMTVKYWALCIQWGGASRHYDCEILNPSALIGEGHQDIMAMKYWTPLYSMGKGVKILWCEILNPLAFNGEGHQLLILRLWNIESPCI